MPDATERALHTALAGGSCCMGQVAIRAEKDGFTVRHRDDERRDDLRMYGGAAEAAEIAKWNDAGKYRPLKTAPDLCHGWQLRVVNLSELRCALDHFYPGRLALWLAHDAGRVRATPLRETLNRQSGMYRAAAGISDEEINTIVFQVCRSEEGCLRVILWKRDATGALPSAKLPPEKFDTACDQITPRKEEGEQTVLPLLCQEACALLIGECRNAVKKRADASTTAERQ
jgi:sirohydrochlorin cobaltochelatase